METLIALATALISFILGLVAKKVTWFNNHLIPIQNIVIGIITMLIYFIFTKDISYSILCAGLFSGGLYDLINNLQKIFIIENDKTIEEDDSNG